MTFQPPGSQVHETCEYIRPNGTQCLNPASWLLPEYPVCGHHRLHVPIELGRVREQRRDRWEQEGAALWRRICEEVPTP